MYSLAHLLPLGQRKHIIELHFRPLTLKRFIVIGCKQDRLIPMGTRVTPTRVAFVGKVVGFNFLTMTCVHILYKKLIGGPTLVQIASSEKKNFPLLFE